MAPGGISTNVNLDTSQTLGDFTGGSNGGTTVNFGPVGSPWYKDLVGGGGSNNDVILFALAAVVVVYIVKKKKGK